MMASLILPLMLHSADALPACNQKAADEGIQSALNQCAYREYMIANAELNTQWKITVAAMKASDAEFATYATANDTRPGYFKSLLEAQRGWLRYRDAHCRVEGYSARGGSMEPMLVSFCMTSLTRLRTEELKALITTEQ